MTEEQFKQNSIKSVLEDIEKNKYPCTIDYVSKVGSLGCEWCDNFTKSIFIGVKKNEGAPDFTKGHCNNGQYAIFEDKDFRSQSEWFVCGKCANDEDNTEGQIN